MRPNPQKPADLVTFTEEILNGKHFFVQCSKGHLPLDNKTNTGWPTRMSLFFFGDNF